MKAVLRWNLRLAFQQMVDFLLFCFASVGMTIIMVRGSLFEPFRRRLARSVERLHRKRHKKGYPPTFTLIEFFHDLIHCVQCTGFWCGIFCGLFLVTSDMFWEGYTAFISPRFLLNRLLMLFCCGAACSFLAPLGDLTVEMLFLSKELKARQLPSLEEPSSDVGDSTESIDSESVKDDTPQE